MINDSIYYAIAGAIYLLLVWLLARFLGINELDESRQLDQAQSGDSPYTTSDLQHLDAIWADEAEVSQASPSAVAAAANVIDRRDRAIHDRRDSAIRDRRRGIAVNLSTPSIGAT